MLSAKEVTPNWYLDKVLFIGVLTVTISATPIFCFEDPFKEILYLFQVPYNVCMLVLVVRNYRDSHYH